MELPRRIVSNKPLCFLPSVRGSPCSSPRCLLPIVAGSLSGCPAVQLPSRPPPSHPPSAEMPDKSPLDPNQPVLYIEHCRYRQNYRRMALNLHSTLADALRAIHPAVKLQLRINDKGMPQIGSFEVAIASNPTDDAKARQRVWTGLKRMPSASKIPHVDDIFTPVCHALRLSDPQTESHRRVLTNLRHSEGSRTRRQLQ